MRSLPSQPDRQPHPLLGNVYDSQLEMVRESTDLVKVPPVPEGYELRGFRAGDEGHYEELFHLVFEDEGRLPEILDRSLKDGFFVVEHPASGDLVASCVAMRGSSSPRHPEAGQLGWLVTAPCHTGTGLGTIVSAWATNRLAVEGCRRPFLGTEDFRIAAIAIYLKLGWRPHIYRDDMTARWRAIFSRLGREFGSENPQQSPV